MGSKDKESKSKSKDKDAKKKKDSKKKDDDKKSTRSKSKSIDDTKSSKSKSKDKDAKSSKSKDKSSKDKDAKSSKSKDKKSTKDKEATTPKKSKTKGDPEEVKSQVSEKPQPESSGPAVSRLCKLHDKTLEYFCETTESLVCYDCTVMGPNNTQMHRISKADEAFTFRFQTLNKAIADALVPKRSQLVAQIVRIDNRLDEIKTVKKIIERDIKNEFAGLIERLSSAEGVKTAVLSHDIAEV